MWLDGSAIGRGLHAFGWTGRVDGFLSSDGRGTAPPVSMQTITLATCRGDRLSMISSVCWLRCRAYRKFWTSPPARTQRENAYGPWRPAPTAGGGAPHTLLTGESGHGIWTDSLG